MAYQDELCCYVDGNIDTNHYQRKVVGFLVLAEGCLSTP